MIPGLTGARAGPLGPLPEEGLVPRGPGPDGCEGRSLSSCRPTATPADFLSHRQLLRAPWAAVTGEGTETGLIRFEAHSLFNNASCFATVSLFPWDDIALHDSSCTRTRDRPPERIGEGRSLGEVGGVIATPSDD
ncbi:unnamed protein product [Gadus morhua 'NCC']